MEDSRNISILKIPSVMAFFTMALTCLLSWSLVNSVIYWEVLIILIIGFLYTFKFKTVMDSSFKWKYSFCLLGFVLLKYISLIIYGMILRIPTLGLNIFQFFTANPTASWFIWGKFLYAYLLLVVANRTALFLIGENEPIVIPTEVISKNINKLSKAFIAVIIIALLITIPHLLPKQYSFQEVADMNFARSHHSAVLLDDGRVYITGGVSERESRKSAEVYNPKTKKFERVADLNIAKKEPTLLKLNDGRIFIFGENQSNGYNSHSSSAEIYDPKTDKYELVKGFDKSRRDYYTVLLNDGNILIPGNYSYDFKNPLYIKNIIFNPNTKEIKEANIPILDNYNAIRLFDGNIFIMGKVKVTDNDYKNLYLIYNSEKNVCKELNINLPEQSGFTKSIEIPDLVQLKDGRIMMLSKGRHIYGLPTICFLDLKTMILKPTVSNYSDFSFYQGYTATQLKNGKFLFTGGDNASLMLYSIFKKAGLYNPEYQTYDEIKNMNLSKNLSRKQTISGEWFPHSVYIVGNQHLVHKALGDPLYNTYEVIPDMTTRRTGHAATLLQDGTVLITGGGISREYKNSLKSTELFKIAW